MPGVQAARHRLGASGATLPVIVMTGHGDIALAVEAMKAGAMDFPGKSFDDGALIAALRLALSRRAGDRERDAQGEPVRQRLNLLAFMSPGSRRGRHLRRIP